MNNDSLVLNVKHILFHSVLFYSYYVLYVCAREWSKLKDTNTNAKMYWPI